MLALNSQRVLRHMPLSLMPIERPYCSRCRTRMRLARAVPVLGGKEKRIFECPKCSFMNTVTVPDCRLGFERMQRPH